jgi:hypothetical protein
MSRDDRLSHSLCRCRRQPAVLDDYAHMARAALLLYETTGRADYLERAAAWTHTADRHFWDEASGGYFFTADDSDDVIVRTKSAEDHSTPSGNGVMVEVLARLSCHAGEPAYRQRAEAVTTAFCGELSTGFTSMATLLNAWELLADPVQLTILGPADDAGRHALLRAVADTSLPTRVLSLVVPGQALPAGHPAAAVAAARANGPATALLCRASTCLPPIAAPDVLRATLAAQ